jgi:hypothetical protein
MLPSYSNCMSYTCCSCCCAMHEPHTAHLQQRYAAANEGDTKHQRGTCKVNVDHCKWRHSSQPATAAHADSCGARLAAGEAAQRVAAAP